MTDAAEEDYLERLPRIRDKIIAQRSLLDFTRAGWRYVEPTAFQSNWHIECLCDHYTAVMNGEIKRLVINLPPRHMKSLGGNVFMPAYIWTHDPDPDKVGHGFQVRPHKLLGPGVKFAYISYAQPLSNEHSRLCRQLVESPWYEKNWGHRVNLKRDANQIENFDTNQSGYRKALSFTGKITGFGADIITIDDAHNIKDAESDTVRESVLRTWDEVLPTRLNDPKTGVFIVTMQRSHERDLCGHIIAKEFDAVLVTAPSTKTWYHVCLPARFEKDHPTPMRSPIAKWKKDPRLDGEPLWFGRFPDEVLDEWTTRLGSYASEGQLQQRPVPRGGGLFKRAWFEGKYVTEDDVPSDTKFVRHWDLAATDKKTAAYTAGVKLGRSRDGRYFVHHVVRFQKEGPEVRRNIMSYAESDGYRCEISLPKDPGQAGKVQAADFIRMLSGWIVHAEAETGDKETRAEPMATQAEGGNVYIVRGPWNDAFLDELCTFPNGKWKDQVDALSGAFGRLHARRGEWSSGHVQGLF